MAGEEGQQQSGGKMPMRAVAGYLREVEVPHSATISHTLQLPLEVGITTLSLYSLPGIVLHAEQHILLVPHIVRCSVTSIQLRSIVSQ